MFKITVALFLLVTTGDNFVQEFFEAEIKKLKLKPYYFPLFITEDVLQKEKDHVEGFAPEVCAFFLLPFAFSSLVCQLACSIGKLECYPSNSERYHPSVEELESDD
jgi:hypothetical protein